MVDTYVEIFTGLLQTFKQFFTILFAITKKRRKKTNNLKYYADPFNGTLSKNH